MLRAKRVTLLLDAASYGREQLRGIVHFARQHGPWEWSAESIWLGRPVWRLGRGESDGVIAAVRDAELAETLLQLGKPVVNVSDWLETSAFPQVVPDNVQVGRLIAEHLLERGLRRFAFRPIADSRTARLREAGFIAALAEAGHECHRCPPACCLRDADADVDEPLRRWLAGLPKPIGVGAYNDRFGWAVVDACRRAGIAVPDEVAVVGVDNDELLCDLATPALSSVDVDGQQVGYRAAALLQSLMAGEQALRRPILVAPRQVVQRRTSDVFAAGDPVVDEAARLIRRLAGEPDVLERVYAAVPLSRRALEMRFRHALNRSPGAEVRRARVDRARQFLEETTWPMSQVAEQAGFTDARQLSTTFRLLVGTTPTAYRRRFTDR